MCARRRYAACGYLMIEQIAPHLTTLINGSGWQTGFPPILSNSDMDHLLNSTSEPHKLVAIQDVTCDIKVTHLSQIHDLH